MLVLLYPWQVHVCMYKVFQTHAESYKIKHIYTVEFFLNAQIFLNTHTHTLQNTSSSITHMHECTHAHTHTYTYIVPSKNNQSIDDNVDGIADGWVMEQLGHLTST